MVLQAIAMINCDAADEVVRSLALHYEMIMRGRLSAIDDFFVFHGGYIGIGCVGFQFITLQSYVSS